MKDKDMKKIICIFEDMKSKTIQTKDQLHARLKDRCLACGSTMVQGDIRVEYPCGHNYHRYCARSSSFLQFIGFAEHSCRVCTKKKYCLNAKGIIQNSGKKENKNISKRKAVECDLEFLNMLDILYKHNSYEKLGIMINQFISERERTRLLYFEDGCKKLIKWNEQNQDDDKSFRNRIINKAKEKADEIKQSKRKEFTDKQLKDSISEIKSLMEIKSEKGEDSLPHAESNHNLRDAIIEHFREKDWNINLSCMNEDRFYINFK